MNTRWRCDRRSRSRSRRGIATPASWRLRSRLCAARARRCGPPPASTRVLDRHGTLLREVRADDGVARAT